MVRARVSRVYAIQCGKDGEVERHRIFDQTNRSLIEQEIKRMDSNRGRWCGPHALVTATVTMTDWIPVGPDFVEPTFGKPTAAELIRAGALRHPCPKCGVAVGTPCENLTARYKHGRHMEIARPHQERIDLWYQEPAATGGGAGRAKRRRPFRCRNCRTILDEGQPEGSCCGQTS